MLYTGSTPASTPCGTGLTAIAQNCPQSSPCQLIPKTAEGARVRSSICIHTVSNNNYKATQEQNNTSMFCVPHKPSGMHAKHKELLMQSCKTLQMQHCAQCNNACMRTGVMPQHTRPPAGRFSAAQPAMTVTLACIKAQPQHDQHKQQALHQVLSHCTQHSCRASAFDRCNGPRQILLAQYSTHTVRYGRYTAHSMQSILCINTAHTAQSRE
jgi:hypothetical protein